MTEPVPEYITEPFHPPTPYIDNPEPDYTPEQVEHALDNAVLLVRTLKTEIRRLRHMITARNATIDGLHKYCAGLENRFDACHQERDDYQAVSVRSLGELKACQDGEAAKQPHDWIQFGVDISGKQE